MTEDPEDDLQWLRYWVVLATVHMIELVIIITTIIIISIIINIIITIIFISMITITTMMTGSNDRRPRR